MKLKYLLCLFCGITSCASLADHALQVRNDESLTDYKIQVHVEAGDYDRQNSFLSFRVPEKPEHGAYQLLDPQNNSIPVQIEDRTACFILPALKAGESITLRLLPLDMQEETGVSVRLLEDAVSFSLEGDRPVLHYRSGAGGVDPGNVDKRFSRGGYLHPVISPKGQVITEHYNPDRPHQYGIWSGWSRTEFDGRNPGFWTPAPGTGSIELFNLDRIWGGPVHGGIRARHHFIDKTTDKDIPVVSESWTVRVHNIQSIKELPVHIFDLDAVQLNISQYPFTIHEHVYGGIGFRGNDTWLGEENTRLLTSEGKTRTDGAPVREEWSHVEAHQSRARWAYLSGVVGDERPGIIILVHPENLEFPEPIFMNMREPFFAFSPAVMGDIVINPGESLRFRYRYVVVDSEPTPEFIESLWLDYAHPVKVTLDQNGSLNE